MRLLYRRDVTRRAQVPQRSFAVAFGIDMELRRTELADQAAGAAANRHHRQCTQLEREAN